MRHNYKAMGLLVICFVFTLACTASARSLNEIKQSMIDRAPVIKELKLKGIVGEDNKGYLAFVGSTTAEQAAVAAENTDRKAIYAYFAKQQNTQLSVVEAVQANRKAEKAEPGEFYQAPDGVWHKK